MEKAIKYLENLLTKNDKVVVCFSGGPDSMCLLALLIAIRNKKPFTLIASHVNHNVRKASVKEEMFVEKYCQKNNVIFETMKIENYHDDNFHNEARNIRYKYFEQIVKKYQANYLMTAHHADDLIETVLMRIVRGSTLNGYSGFKKSIDRDGYKIIRPLIENTKAEILNYNKKNNVPFATDLSNNKSKYTRNRYRKNILPFLKKEDPKVHEKFLKFSNSIADYYNYIQVILNSKINNIYSNKVLNITKFLKEDKLIKDKILENVLEGIYQDDLFLINDKHIKEINKLINSNKANLKIDLPNNLVVRKSYDKIYFELDNIDSLGYQIELKDKVLLQNNKTIKIIKKSTETSNFVTRLSSTEIELPLIVRNRHEGDKMIVKKMSGSKKVKDIFINEKVDLKERNLWPIVTDSNNIIVWLPGLKKSKFDKSQKEKYDIIIKYD